MIKNLPEEFFEIVEEPSYQEAIDGWIFTDHESPYSPFEDDIPLTNINIVRGSLKISKRCTNNNELIIGTACVGQLNVILTNIEYPNFSALSHLKGCKMGLSHDIFLWNLGEWLKNSLGYYYIDTVEIVDSGISIVAYDEMSLFDVKPSYSDKRNYRNCWALISEAATVCGVTYTETEADFIADTHKVNQNEGITIDFSQYKTWREIIALAAQMIACNAIITRDEGLKFYDFYLNTSSLNPYGFYGFTEKQRLKGCKFSPYLVKYTSMYITDDSGEEQFYVMPINESGTIKLGKTLMNSYEAYPRTDQEVNQLRMNVLEHISYSWDGDSRNYSLESHPFDANIRFPCVMDLMDTVWFKGGILGPYSYDIPHWGIITSWEWTFQGSYKIVGTGTFPKVTMGISSTEKLISGTTGQISKKVSDLSDSISDIDDEIESLGLNKQNFIDLDILQPIGSGEEGDLKFYGPLGDGNKKLYRYENNQWVEVNLMNVTMSQTDITPGVTPLANGALYLVYE